ncbi:MAG: TetR/AcrR family transcriptional regulator [Chloroflexi bacterium]|nr:TetR/AcrR family transcriptional regulator [Chloroflexota bacterium]
MRTYVQRARAEGRDRTATAIERAALRELRINGYADLRLADVARRAGVARRTLYLHAPTKEVLVARALRRRATAITRRVERWRPPEAGGAAILDEIVALHERTYRTDRQLLEILVDSGAPGGGEVLRSLDRVRLTLIERAVAALARIGALRIRPEDAIALAHAMLAFPTWRAALTGPARRRAPRLIADALRATLLG